MRRSPYAIAEELKDTLCTYLETAYRISNRTILNERSKLLRSQGIVSQSPYVETTPRFNQGEWLRDISLEAIPDELNEFASIGLPVGRFPLYRHQEDALRKAWIENGLEPKNIIVASGTGSGKTEIFYLTILADILREALNWDSPSRNQSDMGVWTREGWIHRRRYENRSPGIRAIILYPMNALVNDQLRRLRKTIATDGAITWQRNNLNGNLIYFGRYTSQTMLPGTPESRKKRNRWESYIKSIRAGWENIDEEFRALGNWPRPDGPEMLCRWNMQSAPPDILLTNYSMLEYMLVRPIEASIFSNTRDWLAESKNNTLTLVLDEAHTYSGARGTEVAYLIRRLFERLGANPDQVRCIATSASLGETSEELARVRRFSSNLFNHPEENFSLIQASVISSEALDVTPTLVELDAFAQFQENVENSESIDDESNAVDDLISNLSLSQIGVNHIQRLYNALENHLCIGRIRDITARNATDLRFVASQIWEDLGNQLSREKATAGLLSAGALARSDGNSSSEIPPLLPSRIHLMFRGLPGLWACINPNCTEVDILLDGERPCGKLYSEPRIWCECGGRVVELFSCRVCGLLIGGGIEESNSHRVWPYEDDFEGGIGQYERYTIFALENPTPTVRNNPWAQVYRNIRTTEIVNDLLADVRTVWEPVRDASSRSPLISRPCPRCGQRSTAHGRTAIEPLRTTGAQAFSVLMEHAFRIQRPRYELEIENYQSDEENFDWFAPQETGILTRRPYNNPNLGRKALAFSDSRQNAARLAGDLTYLHYRDLFRQLMLFVLNENRELEPIPISQLVEHILSAAIERGIDPTFGEVQNFWLRWDTDRTDARRYAEIYLDTYLRREIADRQVGVEALGLARWVIPRIDIARVPPLEPFDAEQIVAILYTTLRILAGENVIVPRSLDPEDWPAELVEFYYRKVITTPSNLEPGSFTWQYEYNNRTRNNRLTRYLEAVFISCNQPLSLIQSFMESLWSDYYRGKLARPVTGNRPGFGIPITQFALAMMPEQVFLCAACNYISAETVNGICLRCHQPCDQVSLSDVDEIQRNYYRLLSGYSLIPEYPDPFPLRTLEHTAQISAEKAATRERRFQDQFLRNQSENPEDPVQHGVDILSVTTTMEMGIDIGDLTVVGLHNTPPTVANYQQRAGRAGRRSDGVAEVITFSRNRSHDQYYYNRVSEIVTGNVRIPTLHLANQVIARRHVNAYVLQRFFAQLQFGEVTTLFEAFGTVQGLLESDCRRHNQFRSFVQDPTNNELLLTSIQLILDGSSISVDEFRTWVASLPDQILELAQNAPEDNLLLDLLIEKGIMPRYAFPVDVVALWTERPNRWNQGQEVQRDLSIALSEYAPGAEVIIDGMIYQSVGLFTPFEDDPNYGPAGWYYECPQCHHVLFQSRGTQHNPPDWGLCSMCNEPIGTDRYFRIMPAVIPQGFRTNWQRSEEKYRGGGQDRAGYATPAQLVAGENSENGELILEDRVYVFQRTGGLYIVNRGPSGQDTPGFLICPICGTDLGNNPNEPHTNPQTRRPCRGGNRSKRAVLLHSYNTDIVLLGVNIPPNMSVDSTLPGGRAAWLSLGTALRQGAAAYLQIDPEELAMGIRPWFEPSTRRLSAEVYIYDTLPNGAGYANEVAENIENILEQTLGIVENCVEACESACYRCLLEYYNQQYHALISRHLAGDIISYMLYGIEPVISASDAESSLEKLRAFAQDIEFDIQNDFYDVPVGLIQNLETGRPVMIFPTHTLRTSSRNDERIARDNGMHPVFVSHFDLTRRPFWVYDQLIPILLGRSDLINIQ